MNPNREDQLLIALANDKLRQCEEQYCISHTAFLDIRQCALLENEFKTTRHLLYGGFEDAERRILLFLPDYLDINKNPEELLADDNPLEILRIKTPKGSRMLGHRDYLGSLLNLGIDRSVCGDIIVRNNGADIIILKSMEDFLLSNYSRAGHSYLEKEIVPIGELELGELKCMIKNDTVASLRLDNIVSSGFKLSRSKASDAISSGIVFINGIQCVKSDKELHQGDKIVLRGKGKLILEEIGSKSRKDRYFISLKQYI